MTCNTSAVAVCCSKASRVSVEESPVLHRDHRLRREVFEQCDLLVGKRPHLLAEHHERAEHVPSFHSGTISTVEYASASRER